MIHIDQTKTTTLPAAAATTTSAAIDLNTTTGGVGLTNQRLHIRFPDIPVANTKKLTFDVLGSSDKACRVVVEWVDTNGGVLYDSTQYLGFTLFNETEDYSQTQLMAANPLLINDNNFWKNKQLLRTLIDSGNNAIEFASDLYNAQLCYDKATDIRNNAQYLFNANS